jgi:two-component system cell cycle response regulator DivK
MRILYVEDNPANISLLHRIARMGGHEVINYKEGEQALENFRRDKPDLILMDLQLAGALGGLDVVRKLRTDGVKTPIIAVTAYAMMGDKERCLEAGCDAYMAKPLAVAELVELVQQYQLQSEPKPAPVKGTASKETIEASSAPASEKDAEKIITESAAPAAKKEDSPVTPEKPAAETPTPTSPDTPSKTGEAGTAPANNVSSHEPSLAQILTTPVANMSSTAAAPAPAAETLQTHDATQPDKKALLEEATAMGKGDLFKKE